VSKEARSERGDTYADWLVKYRLVLRYGPFCFYCGHRFSPTMEGWSYAQIDHLVPRSKGGGDELSNLRLSCTCCNYAKMKKTLHEDPARLTAFRVRRRLIRQRDEDWARGQMRWMERLRESQPHDRLPDFAALAQGALDALLASGRCTKGKLYGRRKEKTCIEFCRASGSPEHRWYFEAVGFWLQPHFIHEQDTQDGDLDPKVDELELLGYFKGSNKRWKYIDPFIDPGRGAIIIEREVRAVEAVLGP